MTTRPRPAITLALFLVSVVPGAGQGVPDNPVPVITAVSPAPTVGSPATTVSVSGDGFVPSSIVQWNGVDRATMFVSSTLLRAAILAADLDLPGLAQVTVVNPRPGGGSSAWLPVPIIDAPAVTATPFVSGLSLPLEFVQNPADPSVQFVVQQQGRIRTIVSGVLQPTDFLDLTGIVLSGGERGLLGLAFPPNYAVSGRFYVYFTNQDGNIVVARFTRSAGNPLVADQSSRFDLEWTSLSGAPVGFIPHTEFSNHNGGHLAFGPDGLLYIGVGDGGSGNDPHNNSQNPALLLGKMLRIDVNVSDADTQGYVVPAGNPFAAMLPVPTRREIWAFGVRNPWKFSFDEGPGGISALVIGDVGQDAFEEIDYEPANRGGRNYGWVRREGLHDNGGAPPGASVPTPGAPTSLTDPIFEYDHTVGQSITGGYVYRGSALGTSFNGRYVFGDFIRGRVWSIALTVDPVSGEATASNLIEHSATLGGAAVGNISSFGRDSQGELYVVGYNTGAIVKIRPVDAVVANPTQVVPGGAVGVTVVDGSASSGDEVRLYLAGVPDAGVPIATKHLNGLPTPPAAGVGSAVVTFTLPTTPGVYEVRLFANGSATATARTTITVAATAPDPLLDEQWHLADKNVEFASANVRPVWPITRGAGVVIGIVDDGLQRTHPDLQPNYVAALSRDFVDGDTDPSPITLGDCSSSANCRGTWAAGIAAEAGDNGIGGSGVAPQASLAGIRLRGPAVSDATEAAAFTHQLQSIAIENNSWGPSDPDATLAGPGPLARAAMATAVAAGRGGKGRIFVFAAGDGRANGDQCNTNGYANSRFAIAVGAVDDTGQQTASSESCSALLVSAPSSGLPPSTRGLTTTDLVGSAGGDSTDYIASFGGTAAAAPIVSGVAALMLARNPALTWRDVQHILVRSSRRVNAGDPSWTAAAFPHSEKYGFGLVDAVAAVNLAASWSNVAVESAVPVVTHSVQLAIPDNSAAGIADTIVVGAGQTGFSVEHVEVELSVAHARRGDLEVTLVSPSGVVSHLATVRPADTGADFTAWRFGTVRHWGESAAGTWTLRVADRAAGTVGTLQSWTLRIFGVAAAIVVEPPAPSPPPSPAPSAPPSAPPPGPTPAPSAAPGAPAGLVASVFGPTVVLTWSAGGGATTYVLEAGSFSGGTDAIVFDTGSAATSFVAASVAPGRYFVRVRGANASGTGAPSNEVVIVVGGGTAPADGPPAPPTSLVAVANGATVTLTWNRLPVGGAPAFYVIEAGSAPGGRDLATLSTGTSEPSFAASGIAPGTYFVRVRAGNAFGISAASNEAILVVGASGPGPCTVPPGAPGPLQFAVTVDTVSLAWDAASGGPTSYLIEAGSVSGAANVASIDTGSTARSLTTSNVAAGTYFVRVRARNACGTGAASNEVTVVVR
ncbi:MAG TPA: S8 family serine peptidase [Vicinamibacterales bacterium]|nr:S8 family serine peptidase [Vicinamibacterales bacterium]